MPPVPLYAGNTTVQPIGCVTVKESGTEIIVKRGQIPIGGGLDQAVLLVRLCLGAIERTAVKAATLSGRTSLPKAASEAAKPSS